MVLGMNKHARTIEQGSGRVTTRVAAAAMAIMVAARAAVAQGPVVALAVLIDKQLRQHCLDGHRSHDSGCPYCVRANLRERAAHRQLRKSYADPDGYVTHCDFSGPHT